MERESYVEREGKIVTQKDIKINIEEKRRTWNIKNHIIK